jgi:hypothetical protein
MTMPPKRSDQIDHAHKFLTTVFTPGDIIEIRALQADGSPIIRLFRDLRLAARAAVTLGGRGFNIYFCLNPLLGNAAITSMHTIDDTANDKSVVGAKDLSIARRNLYLLDIDPVRRSGMASTDEELSAARVTASKVRTLLSKMGWPEPIVLCSGNGIHLLYRGDGCSPHSPEWSHCLKYLAQRYSDAAVKVDTSVHNAARVSRLPGCLNRKGPGVASRPHRMAWVETYPPWTPVSHQQIAAFANLFGFVKPKRTEARNLKLLIDEEGVHDLIAEFPDQLTLSRTTYEGDDTWFALQECPFKGGPHRGMNVGKGKTALVLGPDRFGFSCFSADCRDHSIGDLLRHLHDLTGRWPSIEIWEDDFDWKAAFNRWGMVTDPPWDFVDDVMQSWADLTDDERGPWKAPTREGVAREYADMLARGVALWVPSTDRPLTRDEFLREMGIER